MNNVDGLWNCHKDESKLQMPILPFLLLLQLQLFYGPLSETTHVSQYQNDKTILDFINAEMTGCQWHQLDHMQVIWTSLQADNHANPQSLKFFYRADALPAAQPTASKHWQQ